MTEETHMEKKRPPVVAFLIALVLLGGGIFMGLQLSAGPSLQSFPADAFLERPNDYLGNTYALRGQIDEQLKWEKGIGRLIAIQPESSSERLPVFVPETSAANLHVGQRYDMQIRIEEGGLIYVESLKKY